MSEPDRTDRILAAAERFGLPTVLLLGGSYIAYTAILRPIAETYQQTIRAIGDEVKKNDEDDGERVKELSERLKAIDAKLERLIEK